MSKIARPQIQTKESQLQREGLQLLIHIKDEMILALKALVECIQVVGHVIQKCQVCQPLLVSKHSRVFAFLSKEFTNFGSQLHKPFKPF